VGRAVVPQLFRLTFDTVIPEAFIIYFRNYTNSKFNNLPCNNFIYLTKEQIKSENS
jgi:hypothetical protein